MRLILQRVCQADVFIKDDTDQNREIQTGLLILLGITDGDNESICDFMAQKAVNLRIFEDNDGRMNLSLLDVSGGCLVVPNFTLYANSRKGKRPSFTGAAHPSIAEPLYKRFIQSVKSAGITNVATGEFGADMKVNLINDGPVTIILDSAEIMP